MTSYDPPPDPRGAPPAGAPPAAGGTRPGETPPAESGTGPGTGPYRPPTRGWGRGPLVAIVVLAVLVALFFLAYAIVLAV
ncbi:DUF6480 family protein [Streptomyces sp. NPDC012421]|uniref:DUF6480 family protein n=1 Tax=unclassified Streptomyces TaxID=2593676 RepID=UPI0036D11776